MVDLVVGIVGLVVKSVWLFCFSEVYVEVMKEDLVEWFNVLYGLGFLGGGDGFLMGLVMGMILC